MKSGFGQSRFIKFGNHLHTGELSFDFIAKRRIWFAIGIVAVIVSILIPIAKGGFNFGMEFTGGSQFQIANVANAEQQPAIKAVKAVVPESVPRVTIVGDSGVRVQTEKFTDSQTKKVRTALAGLYKVSEAEVSTSYIGPSWGEDVSKQAIQGLIAFLAFATIAMALYFRTWKMSLAAILALVQDLVVTAGIYALTGFEITPAAMIGFLTILAYSLYDTVVVFDKIKENTHQDERGSRRTFAQSVNLAVNQTLVRSINTGVVAALPVGTILFVGAYVLGADTLRDISLALLVGIVVGTISTIYIASPLYALLRQNEPEIRKHDAISLAAQASGAAAVGVSNVAS